MLENQNEISPTEELIKKAKESEDSGAHAFMQPEVKQAKRGRGRPKKDGSTSEASPKKEAASSKKDEAPKFDIPTKMLCYPIVKGISSAGVNYCKDPRAALTPSEADDMAGALGMILDKYMPDAAANYGPELMLGLSFGQYALRLHAIKELQKVNTQQVYREVKPDFEPAKAEAENMQTQARDTFQEQQINVI